MSAGNVVAVIIDKVLTAVGLRQSEHAKLEKQIAGWRSQKKGLGDQVDALKAEIGDLGAGVRAKSAELKASRSDDSSAVIEYEIKDLLDQLDLKKGKRNMVFGSMAQLNTVIERGEQALTAGAGAVSADTIIDLTGQWQRINQEITDTSRLTTKLRQIEVADPSSQPINNDLDRRREPESAASEGRTQTAKPSVLSAADRERMSKLLEQ